MYRPTKKRINRCSPLLENLYFRQIIQKWPNFIRYLSECFWYSLQYLLRGWILQPLTIIFVICLLFDLGYRGLWFASRTNLESGTRFAEVCIILIFTVLCHYFAGQDNNIWSVNDYALRDLLVVLVQKFRIDEVYDSKVKAQNWEKLIEVISENIVLWASYSSWRRQISRA